LTSPDNAPEKWVLNEHTKVKHIILEKYLRSWLTILGSFRTQLAYFDCFAGRGVYINGEPGSPIIVMRAAQEQINKTRNKLREVICFFIENNTDNFKSLKKEIEKNTKYCPDCKCYPIFGDFNNVIIDFLNKSDREDMIPSLFFIDPFGWKGIPFTTIQRILKYRYNEIIFVLMTYEIARFISSQPHENSLTELYGGEEWRSALKYTGEKRHKALVQIYREKLKTVSDKIYVWSFRVNDSQMKKRTKYYVIHVCHNVKGLRVMKDIMRKAGSGIFEYLGPDDDVMKYQTRFDVFDLEKYLLNHFKGRHLSFDDLCNELYPITEPPISNYVESDFRNALKRLEHNGRIRVKRVSSKTNRGLRGRDLLYFPE